MKGPFTLHELVVGRVPGVVVVGAIAYVTAASHDIRGLPAVLMGLAAGLAFELWDGGIVEWWSVLDALRD